MMSFNETVQHDGSEEESKAAGRESLESRQRSLHERMLRSDEGEDAGLTEVAAPEVAPETETGDDLEKHESLARKSTDRSSALAEVAAPEPIPESDTTKRKSQDSEEQNKESTVEETQSVAAHARAKIWIETATVAWLIFFSLLGTLARLGVEAIATYPDAPVSSPVLWANLGGSLLLGFLVEDRRLFRYSVEPHLLTDDKESTHRHVDKHKKILPLYIGLATGFCGSFTSFSTFITDGFLALSNSLPPPSASSPYHTASTTMVEPRNGGYSFMAVLAILILHPAVSISAMKTGAHLAAGLERVTPSLPAPFIHRILDPLAVPLGFGCWLGAFFLTIWPPARDWRSRATMALIFAPLGTLLRFYLSRALNARMPAFPLGTFAANILGTCIEGLCYDLQHANAVVSRATIGQANACAILDGVMQGFCGCATTVSTWVVELNGLRRRHAWLYGSLSIGVALGFQVAIMGSLAWSVGFSQTCAAWP